jgi:hypothetical protein
MNMNQKLLTAFPLFAAIIATAAVSGCSSSQQIISGTGSGTVYAEILGVEHYSEWGCDNWLVYFKNDMGHAEKTNPGAYCIQRNSPEILAQLTTLAEKKAYVAANYETAYGSLCGCDYSAWIYEVKELNP